MTFSMLHPYILCRHMYVCITYPYYIRTYFHTLHTLAHALFIYGIHNVMNDSLIILIGYKHDMRSKYVLK